MNIRARTILLAALAVVLPQLTVAERGSAPDAGDAAAPTSSPHHDAARPATEAAHASLPDVVVDRFSSNPFTTAAAAFDLEPSATAVRAPATVSPSAPQSALVTLPRPRAPPAHS